MGLAPPSESAWGLVEWGVTALATLAASGAGLIWGLTARLERMSAAIDRQRSEVEAVKQTNAQLSERLSQLLEDHHRLRETIAVLPNRVDLRELEDHIGDRIEALGARIDRALGVRTY
jgi:small-conductance mechanosensitive channel